MSGKEQFAEAAEKLARQYERNADIVQMLWNDKAGHRMAAMLEEDLMTLRELIRRNCVMEGNADGDE